MCVFQFPLIFCAHKKEQNCYYQTFSASKYTKNAFAAGEAYSAPPDPLAGFRGGKEGGRGEGKREGRRKEGKGVRVAPKGQAWIRLCPEITAKKCDVSFSQCFPHIRSVVVQCRLVYANVLR